MDPILNALKTMALAASSLRAAFDAANVGQLTPSLLNNLRDRVIDGLIFICVQMLMVLHTSKGGAAFTWEP